MKPFIVFASILTISCLLFGTAYKLSASSMSLIANNDSYTTPIGEPIVAVSPGLFANDTYSINTKIEIDTLPQKGSLYLMSQPHSSNIQTLSNSFERSSELKNLVVNGRPAVVFSSKPYGVVGYNLVYQRAQDQTGTSWETPITIGSITPDLIYSFVLVDNIPAVLFWENEQVKIVKALDSNGINWGSPVQVYGGEPYDAALSFINGKPVVAIARTNGDLIYISANDNLGTSWGAPRVIDTSTAIGNVSGFSKINLSAIDGNPALVYEEWYCGIYTCTYRIKYVRATDVNGTGWGSPIELTDFSFSFFSRDPSLAVINGNPAISFLGVSEPENDVYQPTLFYMSAKNAVGSIWNPSIKVIPKTHEFNDIFKSSLSTINNVPAISFTGRVRPSSYSVYYAQSIGLDGVSWMSPISIDNNSNSPSYLLEVNNRPFISYIHSNSEVRSVYLQSVESNSGAFQYSPKSGHCGPDEFSYRLKDPSNLSNTATVTINIVCHVYLPIILQ